MPGPPSTWTPEQWEDEPERTGARTDLYRRTDVYGLGAILYEVLTGRPPFLPEENRNETRRKVRFDDPPRPRTLRPGIPRELEAICVRCLRKRPADRYATAKEVSDTLGRFLGGYPVEDCSRLTSVRYFVGRHRRPTAVACAGLLLLAAVLGLFVSTRWMHKREEAMNAFEGGRELFKKGRVTEGLNRMRVAIDLLPYGETIQRGYFSRNVKSLESSLSREVDHRDFPSEIQAAVVSADPEERYVLVGDAAGKTTLWDRARKMTEVLPTRAGRSRISAVALNKAGTLCASGDLDGNVTVWDVQLQRILRIVDLGDLVNYLSFFGNNDRLLTRTPGGKGPALQIWDVFQGGGKELRLKTGDDRPATGGEFVASPTGDRFVSVHSYSTNACQLWDAETGRLVAELPDEAESASLSGKPQQLQATFSADGLRLLIVGARLTLYDARTGAVLRRVDAGPWKRVRCIGLRDDGGVTLVLDTRDATVFRRMTPDLEVWDDVPMDPPASLAEGTTFTARGRVVTGLSTRTLFLLEPPPLGLHHSNLGLLIGQAEVVASGDGSRIATLARPTSMFPRTAEERRKAATSILQIWESVTLRLISRVEQPPEGCVARSIAYGPTADSLALGCYAAEDGQAPVLIATLAPDGAIKFERLGSHSGHVRALAFTPDGTRLVTGTVSNPADGHAELKCWDPKDTSGPLWKITYPTRIDVIAISPDGKQVVVGGKDGLLRLYPIDRVSGTPPMARIGTIVAAVAFAHDRPLLAVSQATDRVLLFDISDGSFVPMGEFDEPGASSSKLAFSQDDETLYVKGTVGLRRRDVQTKKSLDPVIPFADPPYTFTLTARPEAVLAVMLSGKLIQRMVPNSTPHH